jgi:EF-P beta-lysylation protein EpmB
LNSLVEKLAINYSLLFNAKTPMIPLTDTSWQTQSWQQLLKSAITEPEQLARILNIELEAGYKNGAAAFPLRVPWPYLARIKRGDPTDPLLLQVLPQAAEALEVPGYQLDPLQELSQSPAPGLIQKYHSRVLVVTTGACGIHCRYCFRRHFPYEDFQPDQTDWDRIFESISADTSIEEVILSGGDPLLLNDRQLAKIADRLSQIPHIRTLRLHTRLPIVIPQRIDSALLAWIRASDLNIIMVVHTNHANEIDSLVANAMAELRGAGVTLLNQSVLLRGINDRVEDLVTLSRTLFYAGILPYYLHVLDPVAGAAHFDLTEASAQALMAEVTKRLPGYLVPKLAREIPGEASKTQLAYPATV